MTNTLRMLWTRFCGIAKATMAAALIAAPVTVVAATPPAYADCGDPGQPPCTGPVPTEDEVQAVLAKLTDSNIPAADKGNIVAPPFTPEEAGTIDDHLNRMGAHGLLPTNWVVTNIQSAPDNFAGVTIECKVRCLCRKRRNPGDVARPVIVPGSSFAKSMERSEHVKQTGRPTAGVEQRCDR